MSDTNFSGASELRDTRQELRGILWLAAFFSIFLNVLLLTGPLFMLQTYDRVLSARSESTLVALAALMAFLFLLMGVLDWARGRLLTRLGASFQAKLDRRVFNAILKKSVVDQKIDDVTGSGQQLKDLEAVHRLYSSPVFAALFDAPWSPIFLIGMGLFHPLLGGVALAGGAILLLSAVLNQMTTKVTSVKASVQGYVSDRYAEQLRTEAETIRSLGMQTNAFEKWALARRRALELSVRSADMAGGFATISKTFRMFLQSAMLGVGAYLVLKGEIAPGVMIASSILMGRALQPIETIVNQWPVVQRSMRAWNNIASLLSEIPVDAGRVELPAPRAHIEIDNITVLPPKGATPTLRQLSFTILPGEAVGVIGPSGSGKSTLARSITGMWPLVGGKIRLDGAPLDQYEPERLAQYIGYLPQRVSLFDGTIAENIARLSTDFDGARVVEAAQKAAAHEMILRLPQGYNTHIQSAGTQLSGGQVQRIGLARALYGNPVLLVLDEPNSNLDNEGSIALNRAIIGMKEAGNSVLIMAHRPSAIKECDKLLVLEDGLRKAWGPREQIMSAMLANVQVIRKTGTTAVGLS